MLKVLVVDDDPSLCLLTRRLLTMLNCESVEARSGFDAEALVPTVQPDLILLDIMMPLQDGYETCRNLRTQGYTGPIIMISALQEQNEKKRTIDAGATAYLQKPITRQILALHIEHVRSQQKMDSAL